MSKNRPSFGEFSGYFNVCEADYAKFAADEWFKDKVICDQQVIPRLTSRENKAAKTAVAKLLLAAGYQSSDLEVCVSYLWPDKLFSIEFNQTDRSIRAYLSTAAILTMELLEQTRAVLHTQFPRWRVVIVLPRGEEADVVVYSDSIRIGDKLEFNEVILHSMRSNWVAAENQGLSDRSTQIHAVNHALPVTFLDRTRSVFLLKSFAWSIEPERAPTEFTVWFACVGKRRAFPAPHSINSLEIDGREYLPSSFCLYGLLDRNERWSFVNPERAFGNCCYFLVPPFNDKTGFTVCGYESGRSKNEPWRFSAKFGHSLQKKTN
ncbi:MAG: hypothetical protein SFV81_17795 [Pirellulaceae bacterium]|nr:hypothetical protein [Pirellulaceae bacterium]